jgi:hypothetical protein
MIIGRDLMIKLGLDAKRSDLSIEWDDAAIPWHDMHLKGHFFGLWSNPVARGTGFLQFGLTIRHF